MITFSDIESNQAVKTYIRHADNVMAELGYTEHSFAHVKKVALKTKEILETLGYPEREIELAQIAGYMHDIGNMINRVDHAQSGGLMAFRILNELGMDPDEISIIASAIGHHDEGTAVPVHPVAAALILADKTDVRRSRVRNTDPQTFDIHDRVNFAVEDAQAFINEDQTAFTLSIRIDTAISAVMDYFEIFLGRMLLCRRAAEKLGLNFTLVINDQIVL